MVDVAIFDLDGTLTDSAPGILGSLRWALNQEHISLDDDSDEALRKFLGPPMQNAFMDFYGFSQELADSLTKKYRAHYRESGMLGGNSLYPGTIQLLERLSSKGIIIMLGTSKPLEIAKIILEHFHISQYFNYLGGASMDGKHSAKADIIRDCLCSDVFPKNAHAVMIGDRKYDVEGARAVGIDVIGALYGYGDRAELALSGCSVFANTTEEVLSLLLAGRS